MIENTGSNSYSTVFIFHLSIHVWNQGNDPIEVKYGDSCKIKLNVSYFPNYDYENIRYSNYFPYGCREVVTPVIYDPGPTKQNGSGGITFINFNHSELPFGVYRIIPMVEKYNFEGIFEVNIIVTSQGTFIDQDEYPIPNDNISETAPSPFLPFYIGILTIIIAINRRK